MLSPEIARLRAWLVLMLLVTMAVAASLAISPGPARADGVRDDQLWVLDALRAPEAWPVTEGQRVTVAVIDSGVNPEVSDLTGSVTSGPDLTGVGTPPSDPNWGMHGTWMASLIAGHGDGGGGSGILGIAPRAHVLSIRVITDQQDPGYARYQRESQQRVQRELAGAITYAVKHHAKVISMSLGYGRPSLAVRHALQVAFNHNVVVVASSGNSGASAAAHGRNAPYSFPADYPGVLGVAAVKSDGTPAGFSSDNLSVQIAAPGVKVPAQGSDDKYWLVSGTSPACALTAGVAALIKAKYPALSPALVRQAITTTAANAPVGGYDAQVGFGTVDAPAALSAAGRLAAQARQGEKRLPKHAVQPASYFGGGPSAAPPAPVGPRGMRQLVLFCLLGLVCLVVVVVATSRLATMRRKPAASHRHSVAWPPE
jgi:subtilisin family serine protease